MTKKLLALLLAMCMIFSVCSVSVAFAETSTDVDNSSASDPTGATEEVGEPEEEKSITIDVKNNYYPDDTVTVTGSVEGDITGVDVMITCKEDDVDFEDTLTVGEFMFPGVEFELDDATVGAEYTVTVRDFADEKIVAVETFVIKKEAGTSSNDKPNNATGTVTIWIEGLTDRYIDKTTVSLKAVDDATVLGVAEYVLDEEGRKYRLNADKSKIDRIATTATGSTYLRDGYGTSSSSSKNFADCEWGYFLNGKTPSTSMEDMEVENGDEIIIYFGEPGEVGYPEFTIEPENGITLNDKIIVTVENSLTGEPVKGAKVYFYKRNSTTKTGGTTDSNGVYDDKKATSSFISTYQGGTIRVSGYQSSSKPPLMVSVDRDLLIERDGSASAYITIQGAHKTLLERTKTSKIAEYDLLNFAIEAFEDEDIEYELNSSKDNFDRIELKNASGYYNETEDLGRGSGWFVCVNGTIYTPDDDLEDVDVFAEDEILFYFGDENTIPVVYYEIDGELETDETVYVYFYSDEEKTEPLSRFDVYFDGDDVSKRLTTNSSGRVTLPTVEYRDTYELSWGEQVGVKDDYCPYAVYTVVELKYTGTSKPVEPDDEEEEEEDWTPTYRDEEEEEDWYECEYCGDEVSRVYDVEYKGSDISVCKSCKNEIEEEVSDWEDGDYNEPDDDGDEDFVAGPSEYYPDQNIDSWAVANINKAYEYGLMSGTTHGYFEPQREITRAEFTAIICRILGLDTDASFTQKFADVKTSDWHFAYVMAAYQAGYVTGKSDTSFAPNDYITREEIAVLVSRIIQVTGAESDVYEFADGASVSAWARIYVAAVNKTGIMTGDQFNQFLPKNKVNRQTVATIAVRLYEYLGN